MDPRSDLLAGITGSDIIWESGLGKNTGEEIPVYDLNENVRQSALYIGVNTKFAEKISRLEDLDEKPVVTKYPNIARDLGREKGIALNSITVPGTDEAIQYIYGDYPAILGILSSGNTIRANDIKILEIFYRVTVRMIDAPGKMTSRELAIFEDLREMIAVALQRKRML